MFRAHHFNLVVFIDNLNSAFLNGSCDTVIVKTFESFAAVIILFTLMFNAQCDVIDRHSDNYFLRANVVLSMNSAHIFIPAAVKTTNGSIMQTRALQSAVRPTPTDKNKNS